MGSGFGRQTRVKKDALGMLHLSRYEETCSKILSKNSGRLLRFLSFLDILVIRPNNVLSFDTLPRKVFSQGGHLCRFLATETTRSPLQS